MAASRSTPVNRIKVLKVAAWLNEKAVNLQGAEKLEALEKVSDLFEVYSSMSDSPLPQESLLKREQELIQAWSGLTQVGQA